MLLTRVWLLDRGRMQCLEKGKQDCAPLPAPLPPPQSTSPLPLTPPPAVVCIPFLFFASWCFLTFTVPSPTDSLLFGFLFTSSILALTAHVYCSSLMTTLVLVYYRNRSSGKPPVTLWSQIAMNVPSVCVYVCVSHCHHSQNKRPQWIYVPSWQSRSDPGDFLIINSNLNLTSNVRPGDNAVVTVSPRWSSSLYIRDFFKSPPVPTPQFCQIDCFLQLKAPPSSFLLWRSNSNN